MARVPSQPRWRPIGAGVVLISIAALLSGSHQVAAQEACAQAPAVNDLCPDWTAVHDGPTIGPVISVDTPSALAAAPDGSRIFVAGLAPGKAAG